MGWDLIDADIYMYIYAAYNTKKMEDPSIQITDMTTEDLDQAMYSELSLYDNYKE